MDVGYFKYISSCTRIQGAGEKKTKSTENDLRMAPSKYPTALKPRRPRRIYWEKSTRTSYEQTSGPPVLLGRLPGRCHDGVGRGMRGRSAPRLRQGLHGAVRLPLRELPQPVPETDHLQPMPALVPGRRGGDVSEVQADLY